MECSTRKNLEWNNGINCEKSGDVSGIEVDQCCILIKSYEDICQGSVVCHVFPPLVSIFGLFPVIMS